MYYYAGLLSLAFCFVGSGKKRKHNEATKEAETPQAKIKLQTPNTFPKRKKVCLIFFSRDSPLKLERKI
jgi:hypothetical protein